MSNNKIFNKEVCQSFFFDTRVIRKVITRESIGYSICIIGCD